MSVTIAAVRSWKPEQLDTAGGDLGRVARQLDRKVEGIRSTMDDLQVTWDGDAAAVGDERAAEERRTGVELVTALETARDALKNGSADIAAAKRSLFRVIDDAEARGFQVSDDGDVTPPPVPNSPTGPGGQVADPLAAMEERNREVQRLNREAQEIADDISRELRLAVDADEDVASALRAVEFPQTLRSRVDAYLERYGQGDDAVLAALGAAGVGALALGTLIKDGAKLATKSLAYKRYLDVLRAPATGPAWSAAKVFALDEFKNGKPGGGFMRHLVGSRAATTAGKAFLPLTVLSGGMDVVTGGGYDGARGATTRVLGGAGALGAGALMLGATGVGAPIAAGAVLLYGAWSVGNLVYDNWDDIKDFGGDVVDKAGEAASWVGDKASDIGEGALDMGKGAVSAIGGLFD